MKVVSVALGATYTAVLSLQGLDTNGPIGFGVSVAETSSDGFILYGTLDAAAVNNANAWNLGAFTGGLGNLPRGVAEQAKTWPFVLALRTSGATAGSLFVAGNPAASPAVVSTAAPVAAGNYSALMTLTTLGAGDIRLGGDAAMTTSDVFDVFASNDPALASSVGAERVARICGGGGDGALLNTARFSGYNYAIVQRVSGSTAGNLIAAGVAPSAGGGILNLTTLAVGNTAVNGPIGALTAAQSVDIYSSFLLTQTTAGITATLPNPTITTAGKVALVASAAGSTTPIIMYGQVIRPGSFTVFEWNGAAWTALATPLLNQTTLAVADTAVNGPIGALTATATVDIFSAFVLTQTTAGVVATLPNPTVATATRLAIVELAAASTQPIVMYEQVIGPGFHSVFSWNGLAWVAIGYVGVGGNAPSFGLQIGTINAQNVSHIRNNVVFLDDNGTLTTLGDPTGARGVVVDCGTRGIVVNGSELLSQNGVAAIADGTGTIGLATATVDLSSMILVNQTTPVVLYANMRTIPAPTIATAGRKVTICNVGTAAFIIGDVTQLQGINLIPGTTPGGAASANKGQACTFTWNGTAWVPDDTGLGVPVVAAGLADADAPIPRAGRYTIYRVAALANNRVLTASLTGALIGDYIDIIRDDGTNANTLTINNAAAATLAVMPVSKKATCRIAYLGTGDWQLAGGGAF